MIYGKINCLSRNSVLAQASHSNKKRLSAVRKFEYFQATAVMWLRPISLSSTLLIFWLTSMTSDDHTLNGANIGIKKFAHLIILWAHRLVWLAAFYDGLLHCRHAQTDQFNHFDQLRFDHSATSYRPWSLRNLCTNFPVWMTASMTTSFDPHPFNRFGLWVHKLVQPSALVRTCCLTADLGSDFSSPVSHS